MPQPVSFAKCTCQHCGGHIEFPVHAAGQKICCPHCDKPTLLFLSTPAPLEAGGGRAARKQVFLVSAIVVVMMAVAIGGAILYKNSKSSRPSATTPAPPIRPGQSSNATPVVVVPVPPPKPKPPPDPWHGLKPSKVTLDTTGDGRLVYAIGTLTNDTKRQRFGVKVELDVLDEHRNKLGTATDYTDVIEPGKEWKFRALVIDKAAAGAKLTKVREQQ